MVSHATLKIEGYRQGAVPNTFHRQGLGSDHLAIVLPGRGYTCDMPLLYYSTELLLSRGADVLQVDYNYSNNADFREVSEAERSIWLGTDVAAAAQTGLKQRNYKRITLIGKSLGTLAAAHLLTSEAQLMGASTVWLTPILGSDTMREQILRWDGPSLFVIGSADDQYDAAQLTSVKGTRGQVLVLEGADHSLEVPGDIWRSLEYLQQVTRAIDNFLAATD